MPDHAELERLLAAATKGPWYLWRRTFRADYTDDHESFSFKIGSCDAGKRAWGQGHKAEANAALIVAAVNALPSLLAEVKVYREALTLALPILKAEREIMVSSHMNHSGPDKGAITDPEAIEIIGELDAAINAASAALQQDAAHAR